MSEESSNTNNSELKLPVIPFDSTIKIEISGQAYNKLTRIMYDFASQKTPEAYKEILDHLRGGGRARDKYEFILELYLGLLYEIETKAQEQGVTKMVPASEIKPLN